MASNKRVRLLDIAAKCGVSVNTVSHALNDKNDISEETKDYIRKAADEMGYIHNSSASFMRSGKTKSIAIIIGDISNPHFSIMIKEIEITARKSGYTTFVLNTDENEKLEKDAIITAISKNADGIILCPVQKNTANIEFLIKSGIPFSLIGRRFENIKTNYVVCDDENSGFIAAEYILDRNKGKIAVLNAPEHISSARERLSGIKKGFDKFQRKFDEGDIYTVEISNESHEKVIKEILSKDYEGVICFSDIIALELLSHTDKKLDIVSFDNILSKFHLPYKFKSITSSKTKMSHETVDILLKAIEGEDEIKEIVLSTKLS